MARKIKIKCQYYWVKSIFETQDESNDFYSLEHWIAKMSEYSYATREKSIGSIRGRLEHISKNDELYALNFVKMGDYSSTYVVKQGEAAKHVDISIENDEYIGSNTVALYDSKTSIMIIMGTRSGFSVNTITVRRRITIGCNSKLKSRLTPIRPRGLACNCTFLSA